MEEVYPSTDGSPFFQPYGLPHQAIYSVSRFDLNQLLHGSLDKAHSIEVHYNYALDAEDGQLLDKLDAQFDGVFGVMAYTLVDAIFLNGQAMSQPLLNKQTTDIEKCTERPLTSNKETQALHIWPRDKSMLIALPQTNGQFAGTLFAPFDGDGGLGDTTTQEEFQHTIQSVYLGKDSPFCPCRNLLNQSSCLLA